jgi:hypothetical protein
MLVCQVVKECAKGAHLEVYRAGCVVTTDPPAHLLIPPDLVIIYVRARDCLYRLLPFSEEMFELLQYRPVPTDDERL